MAGVDLRNIEKRYGQTPVLKGVSLLIRDGEFPTLVGPSGCGKSPLLRVTAGLEAQAAREVDEPYRELGDGPSSGGAGHARPRPR
jgi:multiple sugar transport system ATP-binding protein